MRRFLMWRLVFPALLALSSPGFAQTAGEFYRDRTIELLIWSSPSGAYDVYGRLVARHLPRFLGSGVHIVARNLEGGGGIRLANFLDRSAARDGSVMAVLSRGAAYDQLCGNKAVQYDASRFNWIGSTNNEVSVCVAWHTSGITSFADLMQRELVVGATGLTTDSYQYPRLVAGVLGARLKIVGGYAGGTEIDLAMERGEVQGRCSWSWTSLVGFRRPWVEGHKISVLYQMGFAKHPDLPDPPLVLDLARTDEQRALLRFMFSRQVMAWPFAAPPGVPNDRVEMLRDAFMATLRDPAVLAEATQAGLEVRPVSGSEVQQLIAEVAATPPAIAAEAAALIK